MHHDFFRLENGNTIINRYVLIPGEIAARVKGGVPGTEQESGMWTSALQEITPEGKVVWEWLGHEHLDPEIDILCPFRHRTLWGNLNGFSVLPDGDIVASFRYINTIAIIDRKSGAIKWRWGAPYELGHQHNPTPLENGNILVFDNGFHRVTPYKVIDRSYSRVIEVNPKTNEIEWEYVDETVVNFYSAVCSSAQRLPNGNTFICESTKGRIFEVTPSKEIVWQFINPFYYPYIYTTWPSEREALTNLIFKAHRYGHDYEGLTGKDLSPDRFEWVLREKGKPSTERKEDKGIKDRVRKRLKQLGY
jgi:hypothetical protein